MPGEAIGEMNRTAAHATTSALDRFEESKHMRRLMARRRGRPASNMRGGHNKKLDVPQDQALRDYLIMLAGAGIEANLAKIKKIQLLDYCITN